MTRSEIDNSTDEKRRTAVELELIRGGVRELNRTRTGKPYTRFEVRPSTPVIGAELRGVDLAAELDGELRAELRRALLEFKVIFFRDQEITSTRQLEIARIWGEPEANPFFPTGDEVNISRLAKDGQMFGMENVWHSDHSFLAKPARGAVLRAAEVPANAGDTMWADMAAAYDNLPEDVRTLIHGLEAEHDWISTWGRILPDDKRDALREELPTVVHPVVKVHPETGRRTLYVNEPFTVSILGIPEAEGQALLEYLRLQARVPEYQVRFRWAPGSVAIWDNWAVQHYAINDYYPSRRVMERVAIAGDGWD
ncbi:TauD/TfdA dioxygenase family protein [Saccharopolyspora elongata]|uniref:Taurine dioxygenase n=1 Tax=Saccharopolyspora elongata TaxID=2530387 RepID=A0A4R4YCV2_9PSEU|nr:TauD/TfdA family dioxygenase [Saccharopolyspora elongata]TDD42445.1 taurine dioxygenase [Saccharopolyspora elongata]